MADAVLLCAPSIAGNKSLSQVTHDVCAPMEARPGALWWMALGLSVSLLLLGGAAIAYQIATGVGTWGLNRTIGWGFDITNFVFWIGIGHAGTLISAILFLLRQRWRTSVNRAAEAMTIFAVMCAGIFPVIHTGRPWFAYWLIPYPNTRGSLWVNFRSPLVWDFFAISTYFTISAMFWYIGLLPDMATIRDRDTAGWRRKLAGILALGSCTSCSPAWEHRLSSRSTPSSAGISPRRYCPDGTLRFSHPTSSPEPFSAAWRWCSRS
jgi:molybdopterin-containing oxidoreductase family membrane subunit